MRILILDTGNHYGDSAYWHRRSWFPSTAATPNLISINGSSRRGEALFITPPFDLEEKLIP